jgi:hypothetical protein
MSQDIAETVVGAMLWDCGDGGTRYDDDTVGGTTHDAVLAVMFDYLTRPFDDAGATGADLVDWLDGWFVMHGTQTCPQVRSLVIDKYHFPYDFQAPAAACGPQ